MKNQYFGIRQKKRKNNSKENILSLMFFVETKAKGEAGTSVIHCLVELFVVATSKIMRCHYATLGMGEGQALCSFCKEKSNFPCLPMLCIFRLSSKHSVLPNNCWKLLPGDFCYFYPTHLFLWTRKHIQYSSPVYLLLPVIPSQL